MRRKELLLLGAMTCLTFALRAQTKLVNVRSGEDIEKGVEYHDNEDYDKAIRQYEKVYRCDTNYVKALYEKSYSLYSLKKYEDAIKVVDDALLLQLENGASFATLLLNKANCLDMLDRMEESVKIYDQLIRTYPLNYLYPFNKAVAIKKLKKDQETVDLLMKTLELNPMHTQSYMQLGEYAREEGKFTIAMINYCMYLCLDVNSDNAKGVMTNLQNLLTITQDLNEKKLRFGKNEDDFGRLDEGIANFAGLNKNYKAKGAFTQAEFVKAMHWVMFNMKLSSDPGFYGKYYVPLFMKFMKEKKFDDLCATICLSSQNDDLQRKAAAKSSKVGKFLTWMYLDMDHNMLKREIEDVNGKTVVVRQMLGVGKTISNRFVIAYGESKKDMRVGYWKILRSNTMPLVEGYYDAKGMRTGLWKKYYEDGTLYAEEHFVAGVSDGEVIMYTWQGIKQVVGTRKAGLRHGTWKYYYDNGKIKAEENFKNGVLEGASKHYFAMGGLKRSQNYVNGKLSGESKYFHPNSKLKETENFKNDMVQGTLKEFYPDGTLKEEQVKLVDGKLNGERITYFRNGKIASKGNFKNGMRVGKHHEYYENGDVESENNYNESGKLHGKSLSYNKQGKLFFETGYDNGEIDFYKFFNKEGKLMQEAEVKKKKLPVKAFYPDGMPSAEGQIIKGEREGLWKNYNHNGVLNSEVNYKAGSLHGSYKTYWLCGAMKSETLYKDGLPHGYWAEYFPSGKIAAQGYYENGLGIGMWKYYHHNGNNSNVSMRKDGSNVGQETEYTPLGKVVKDVVYSMDGEELYTLIYDTAGRVYDTLRLRSGNGLSIFKSPLGQQIVVSTLVNSKQHGPRTNYYPSGKLKFLGYYFNDEKDSLWTWYYPNGVVEIKGSYAEGEKTGLWQWYHPNGKVEIENTHDIYGRKQGVEKEFSPDGVLVKETNFKDGVIHGEIKFYHVYSGQLEHVRNYEEGKFVSYSYMKNGKLIDPIKLENETGNVVTFYNNGIKARELNLKKGIFDGMYKIYHPNGKVALEYKNVCDLTQGKKTIYFENGNIQSEVSFIDDVKDGVEKVYWPNGKLQSETHYFYGDKYGPDKYWDAKGNLIWDIYYLDDTPYYQGK